MTSPIATSTPGASAEMHQAFGRISHLAAPVDRAAAMGRHLRRERGGTPKRAEAGTQLGRRLAIAGRRPGRPSGCSPASPAITPASRSDTPTFAGPARCPAAVRHSHLVREGTMSDQSANQWARPRGTRTPPARSSSTSSARSCSRSTSHRCGRDGHRSPEHALAIARRRRRGPGPARDDVATDPPTSSAGSSRPARRS